MRSSTLHIKVRPAFAQSLRNLAKKRNVPVGELVREAVASSYQVDFEDLTDHQRHAISAYRGGYISMGKFAEEMGMAILEARAWLKERDIAQNNSYSDGDMANA